MGSDGLGVTLVSVGGVLIYAGIKGYSVPDVLRNLVKGEPINQNVRSQPIGSTQPTTPPEYGSSGTMQSAAGSTAQANQNLAIPLARAYGWDTGVQWDSLVELWTRESNWDNHALNQSSGAYGIPQALPYTKMPKSAWPESAGGTADAETQISWGLGYIALRYGLPQFALAFHKQHNWY